MPIIRRITLGPDTISRLQKAAQHRYREAVDLAGRGHHLTSIYLPGYAAEMTIGAAYLELVLGFGRNKPIARSSRRDLLNAARTLSDLDDKSHPFDGLARYLVRERPPSDRPDSSASSPPT